MKNPVKFILILLLLQGTLFYSNAKDNNPGRKTKAVKTISGELTGIETKDGVKIFKGVPYAKPPVGNLRWKAPVPLDNWTGTRDATEFGPRPMQESNLLYSFRSEKMSEDCLYLNVWTTDIKPKKLKPVYIFIHGGSFIRGDGSQIAYDGETMAKQGVVYITINYRLGVFGFMAHPELSKETRYGGSGNYGLLDQLEAIKWIRKNISSFGGDPEQITLGGESVGAQSVNAHMSSPLSQNLFSAAIIQSGSLLDNRPLVLPLTDAEKLGAELEDLAGATSVDELRALPAEKLLKLASKGNPRRFIPALDGYFLKEMPAETFRKGAQADIPLLIGWNAQEVPGLAMFRLKKINIKNYETAVHKLYGAKDSTILALYPAKDNQQVKNAASMLMSDRLIATGTWKLAEAQAKTAKQPVFRYLYQHPHPGLNKRTLNDGNLFQQLLKWLINKNIRGTAFHASEIEYAYGNLKVQKDYAWTNSDFKVSGIMNGYFVNFIKYHNPNTTTGQKLPIWPRYDSTKRKYQVIDGQTETKTDNLAEKYGILEKLNSK